MPTNDAIDHVVRPHVAATEDVYLQDTGSRYETSYLPADMPPEVARIVTGVQKLFSARSMGEHCDVMGLLSRDIVWDAPPILTARKGHLRVAAYWAKSIAYLRLEPSLVTVRQVAYQRHVVEVVGTVYLAPKRSWLVPASLLLPVEVPIRATIKLGVSGPLSTGKIELLLGRWHNLPNLPAFIRTFNGLAMGGVIHLTEPLWSRGMWLLGDNFYSNKRSTTTTTSSWGAQPTTIAGGPYTTQGGYSPAAGYAPSANGSRLPGAAGGVAEVAGAAVGAVTGTASAAVDTVADIGSAAVGGVLDLGSYVFNTVTGTIGAAARVAQQYAGAAVDTAAAAVGTVRDTAADAVSTASTNYHAAKDETYTTVDSNVRRTAERVEGKVERAAEVAEETADAAHAGYARGKVEGYDAGVAKVQRVPGVSTHSVAPAGIY